MVSNGWVADVDLRNFSPHRAPMRSAHFAVLAVILVVQGGCGAAGDESASDSSVRAATVEGPERRSMYTENDLSFPVLRLEDAYVVPTQEFFTFDDFRSPFGEDLREATLVDRTGVVWRILSAKRVALARKGFLSRQRYVRQYQLGRVGNMSLADVKTAILPMIRAETVLWQQGPRVDGIAARIQSARDMVELCETAKELG